MKLTIERAALLRSLAHVQNVVERRTTIPILSNVKLAAEPGQLRLTATELRTPKLRKALEAAPIAFDVLGERILKAAEFRSKGRFAQVLSKHVHAASDAPEYIKNAIAWVTE